MSPRSALTALQVHTLNGAGINLSVGYPRTRSLDERVQALRDGLFAGGNSWKWEVEANKLRRVVGALLSIPSEDDLLTTFSGTTGIARVLQGLVGRSRGVVLTTTPGFDSIGALAEEASGEPPVLVRRSPFGDPSFVDRLSETIRKVVPSVVVLVSPDNPTGTILTEQELLTIADSCGAVDAALVLDQCFALVAPFGTSVPIVSVVDGRANWCMLWDSSKTVELTGERIGLLLPSAGVRESVVTALDVLQLELPITALVGVRHELEVLTASGGLATMNALIRQNAARLADVATSLGLRTNAPQAGSFQLLGLGQTAYEGRSAALAEALLMRHGIAVAPDRVLALDSEVQPASEGFIRVCVACPTESIDKLCIALRGEFVGR